MLDIFVIDIFHFDIFDTKYRYLDEISPSLVRPEDCYLQCIVLRFNMSVPINKYRLLTLTHGTGPASYIATKALEILGNSMQSNCNKKFIKHLKAPIYH